MKMSNMHQYLEILLAYAVVCHGAPADNGCPSHLSRINLFSNQNSCVQIVNHHLNWKSARDDCKRQGGSLVEIRDAEMQTFLTSVISQPSIEQQEYWIGATDSNDEGVWRWTSGDKVSIYSYWDSGQGPSHHGGGFLFGTSNTVEDCAIIWPKKHFKWHDYNCETNCSYICQYSKHISQLSTLMTTEQSTSASPPAHSYIEEITTLVSQTVSSDAVYITEPETTELMEESTSRAKPLISTTPVIWDRKSHKPDVELTTREPCYDKFSGTTCETITQNCTNEEEFKYCRLHCKLCCGDDPRFDCKSPTVCSSLDSVRYCPFTCGYCPCRDIIDCIPLRHFCSISEVALQCAKTCSLCT